jgi:hypothetical protein
MHSSNPPSLELHQAHSPFILCSPPLVSRPHPTGPERTDASHSIVLMRPGERVFEPFLSLHGTRSAISDYTVTLARQTYLGVTCLILMAAYLMVDALDESGRGRPKICSGEVFYHS